MNADWGLTLLVMGFSASLLGLSIILASRPRRDSPRPRMISWPFMVLLSGALLMLALVHLLNLMGVKTGPAGGRVL